MSSLYFGEWLYIIRFLVKTNYWTHRVYSHGTTTGRFMRMNDNDTHHINQTADLNATKWNDW